MTDQTPDNPKRSERPEVSRRELFRAIGRGAALAAVAAGVWLAWRRGRSAAGEKCINRGICRGCQAYDDCRLPAALSRKAAEG